MDKFIMLKNRDIIVFALPRWDGKYESTSFNISYELAKENRVLYVDNPFTISEIFRNLLSRQIKKRWKSFFPFTSGLSEYKRDAVKIFLLGVPPVFSINFLPKSNVYNLVSKINHWIVAKRIEKAIKMLNMRDYIFINSFNFFYPDIDQFVKPDLYVYHCVDAMVRDYTLRHGLNLEKRLVEKADIVITTAKALKEEKEKLNPNCFFIPNAADFKHSSKALKKETCIASELAELNKPIIGYFGNIELRIDYDLVRQVFERHPEWTLAMVGPVMKNYVPDWFFNIPNIKLLGQKPYQRMPEFLKGFNVAIIPFKVNDTSKKIFPLKLYEYLGAGKPVVCTLFNPNLLTTLKHIIYLAQTGDQFEQAIITALGENSLFKIEERQKVAHANTWDARGKQFSKLLERWLTIKEEEHVDQRTNKAETEIQKVFNKNYIQT